MPKADDGQLINDHSLAEFSITRDFPCQLFRILYGYVHLFVHGYMLVHRHARKYENKVTQYEYPIGNKKNLGTLR